MTSQQLSRLSVSRWPQRRWLPSALTVVIVCGSLAPASAFGSISSSVTVSTVSGVGMDDPLPSEVPGTPGDAASRSDRPGNPPHPDLLPRTNTAAEMHIRLDSVSPSVVAPGSPVEVRVTISNESKSEAADAKLKVRIGRPAGSRSELDNEQRPSALSQVLPDLPIMTLPAGASTSIPITIPAAKIPLSKPFGVLPLMVEVTRGRQSSTLTTFLPFMQVKEFEPLSLAVTVPVTPDANPQLNSADLAVQENAWAQSTGSGSRVDRILSGTANSQVTYAVDPALLGTNTPVTSTPSPTSPAATPSVNAQNGSKDAPGTPPPELPLPHSPSRAALTSRLATAAKNHPVWELPQDDPDLAQVMRSESPPPLLERLVRSDGQLGRRLSPSSLKKVVWPQTSLTSSERRQVAGAHGKAAPDALVLPLSETQEPGTTGDASRRFGDGTKVVAYDEKLSRILANSSTSSSAGLVQRFLAETMAILQESPGRARRVLAVAPRNFDPDSGTLATLMKTISGTPWVRPVDSTSLIAAAGEPDAATAVSSADAKSATGVPGDPLQVGASPLNRQQLSEVRDDLRRLEGLAAVLPAGAPSPAIVHKVNLSLLSTRWRGSLDAWREAKRVTGERVNHLIGGVSVAPTQVNFFAESGTLQVTVVNTLDSEVREVRLRLVPQGRSPRLRVPREPYLLTIAARSRAVVKVPAEAIAAGPAVVSAEVSSPSGTRLGAQDTTLTIQVQPTNGWLILALGGAAGAVFLVGLLRTIRRNRPRLSAEDLKEIDIE
ncbi:hypothetical protein SAMN05421595_2912 [Austwickia chelonae]|uniref:Uncharacterized protein n=1 Tax=Austwickia chelonae NBRC 105200 TaxID=1184607 RepID=K6WB62_9MICO|nr:DUF6049 family protein [Austwickia chelonae]GAB79052.1 hypothetical protein AUCHE_18_00530 [Austwickia chelonae NBRC 105200]SEW41905.1 hypothetical protein SAMN05421595_2912 [Austwickia chelonae]